MVTKKITEVETASGVKKTAKVLITQTTTSELSSESLERAELADLAEALDLHGTVDDAMSSTSENPVQNKVVKEYADTKLPKAGGVISGSLTVSGNVISTAEPTAPSHLVNREYVVGKFAEIAPVEVTNQTPLSVNRIYNLGNQISLDITLGGGNVGDWVQIDFYSMSGTEFSISSYDRMCDFELTPEEYTMYTIFCDYGMLYYNPVDGEINGWRVSYASYKTTVV